METGCELEGTARRHVGRKAANTLEILDAAVFDFAKANCSFEVCHAHDDDSEAVLSQYE